MALGGSDSLDHTDPSLPEATYASSLRQQNALPPLSRQEESLKEDRQKKEEEAPNRFKLYYSQRWPD